MLAIRKSIVPIVILLAVFLRFYNLMHDSPYFFNPDERNMANAITQLHFPDNLNPHFFAYGQFPLYLAYFSNQISKFILSPISNQQLTIDNSLYTSFPSAIFWLRFWSALFSIFTVLFVYLITNVIPTERKRVEGSLANARNPNKLRDSSTSLGMTPGVIAALLAAFSPGLIQSAHFGTTESFLTFFFMASIYLSLKYLSNLSHPSISLGASLRFILLSSLIIGLALGSKLTGLFFLIPPFTALMIRIIRVLGKQKKYWIIGLFENLIIGLFLIIGSITIGILSSPYNLINFPDFKSAVFGYEADVAIGIYPAFYTRQFVNTTPIIFQVKKIFPYALGWPVFTLGTAGLLLMSLSLISKLIHTIIQSIKYQVLRIRYKKEKNKNILNTYYLILTTSFLFYLLSNSFLFAKWTRFMTPILPFFSIFAGYFISVILGNVSDSRINHRTKSKDSGQARMTIRLRYLLICLLVFISVLPGIAFISIYAHEDTRVTASKWIYKNIPNNSYILSETANVVDIPLSINNYTVISFDFYHVDKNPILFEELLDHLEKADYILIPSRRIFINYIRLSKTYPLVTKYYQLLFSGNLGFEKAAEISSLPDEAAEETWTVFDHPVIRIYRKITPMTKEQYRSLFKN